MPERQKTGTSAVPCDHDPADCRVQMGMRKSWESAAKKEKIAAQDVHKFAACVSREMVRGASCATAAPGGYHGFLLELEGDMLLT